MSLRGGRVRGKKLLFVTGTRADFGKLLPLAKASQAAGHVIQFFVTGMHMLERYGATKHEVKMFPQAEVHEFINQRDGDPHDLILSKTVLGFSDWVYEHKPDLVVVHGDRVEALAGSLVCAMNGLLCAHVEGGEVSGTIDELYRHCNSKLSSYHFVCSEQAKHRVMSLGEDPDRIFVIGSPELDVHSDERGDVSLQDVKERYDIDFNDYGIAIFHPVTSELKTIGAQAANLFDTLAQSGRKFVIISPNNDPGSRDIFSVIENLPSDRFRHIPSMRFNYFSVLLKNAACLIGNSSAGVREAPFLGVPSLNVGTRQTNRGSAPSITNVHADERRNILLFLEKEWMKRYPRDYGFGRGDAASRFAEVVSRADFWTIEEQKFFYEGVNPIGARTGRGHTKLLNAACF